MAKSPGPADPAVAPPHSLAEDVHALLIGSSFAAFGLVMLKAAGLVTGGVAGIALIVSYLTGWPVGLLFVAINLPFFLLAQRRMGWVFTLKSMATMLALALFSTLIPGWMKLEGVNPAFAAIFGGTLIGMGILSLARHRASVGGIGILALYLQERRGISAGLVQMVADVAIVSAAFGVIDLARLGYSALSALALSLVMLAYHRPGRYAGR
jgi:uncharacterized membrane-anchored protein YitT (DUF2179 family)